MTRLSRWSETVRQHLICQSRPLPRKQRHSQRRTLVISEVLRLASSDLILRSHRHDDHARRMAVPPQCHRGRSLATSEWPALSGARRRVASKVTQMTVVTETKIRRRVERADQALVTSACCIRLSIPSRARLWSINNVLFVINPVRLQSVHEPHRFSLEP